jgi:hypothetical protein
MVGAILANPEKFHAKAKLFGILFVFCFVFFTKLQIDFSDKRFLDIRRALSRTSNSAHTRTVEGEAAGLTKRSGTPL